MCKRRPQIYTLHCIVFFLFWFAVIRPQHVARGGEPYVDEPMGVTSQDITNMSHSVGLFQDKFPPSLGRRRILSFLGQGGVPFK